MSGYGARRVSGPLVDVSGWSGRMALALYIESRRDTEREIAWVYKSLYECHDQGSESDASEI